MKLLIQTTLSWSDMEEGKQYEIVHYVLARMGNDTMWTDYVRKHIKGVCEQGKLCDPPAGILFESDFTEIELKEIS